MMRSPFVRVLMLLVCMASTALMHNSAYGAEPVRIGVLAARPKPLVLAQWHHLAVFLKQAMPKQDFVVEVFTDAELDAAVASRQLDFVLTNPGHYLLLAQRSGLSAPLATLIDSENGHAISAFGGVIFSRAGQANINTLQDIRGKTIATIGTGYLAGYQMQAYELKQAGINLPQDVKLFNPGKSYDSVVEAVLDGRADVGFVRSGLLEHMVQDNKLDMKQVKILNSQNLSGLPVEVSTRLYPEWLFAALPHADENIARHIVSTLLLLEENTAVTHAIGIHGFAVPADYTPVVDLLREMRFPPFEAVPQFTLRDIWARYFWQLVGTLLVFGLILLLSLRLLVAKRKLESQHHALLLQKQQLQRSESHWKTLVHTLPDLIWLKDCKGTYLACNPRFELFFGAVESDIIGKTDYDFVDKELADFFRKHDQAAMDKGAPSVNEEWVTFASDGHRELLETTKVPMLDADGCLIGVLGIGHDITERNQVTEALHQSETKLRTLYESTSDAVMLLDEKGFFDCNKATLAMFGCATKEEFYSMHPGDLSPPEQPCGTDSVSLANQRIATAMKNGRHQFEWMHRRADTGKIFPADVLLNSMELDGRTVLQATVRDITAHKQAENALMLKNLVFDESIAANSIADLEGVITEVNEMFLKVWGYSSKDEVVGKPIPHFLNDPNDAAAIATALDRMGQWEGDYVAKRKDGSTFLAYGLATTLKDENGKLIGFQSAVLDITESRKVENVLQESEEMLRRAQSIAHIGHFKFNPVTAVVDGSDELFRIFGLTREEFQFSDFLSSVHPDDRDFDVATIESAVERKAGYEIEHRLLLRDGTIKWVKVIGKFVSAAPEEQSLLIGTVQDITERKRAEDTLSRAIASKSKRSKGINRD
jgi:PAS domain S-box-containing protein